MKEKMKNAVKGFFRWYAKSLVMNANGKRYISGPDGFIGWMNL